MLQHLKIGVKNSPNRTLRLHFEWDSAISTGVFDACADIANAGDHSSLSNCGPDGLADEEGCWTCD